MIKLLFLILISINLHADEMFLSPGLYQGDMQIFKDGKFHDPMAELKKQMKENPQLAKMMGNIQTPGHSVGGLPAYCLTAEDLKGNLEGFVKKYENKNNKNNCQSTINSRSKTEIKGSISCANGDKGTYTIKIISSKKYEMEMNGDFNGKKDTHFKLTGTKIKDKC